MSQSAIPHSLKKLTTRFPSLQGRSEALPKSSIGVHSRSTEPVLPERVPRILRILLGDPWDDYDYVRYLGQDMVARRKASYFKLVNIRKCPSSDVLDEQPRLLSSIQHPNIAAVYDLYCDGDKIFIVTEHLHISISQLNFRKYELEEWEIATIIAEVLKGMAYISSLKLSCKNFSGANIGLTLVGEIKLVLDLQKLQHNHLHEGSKLSQVLLDFPIIAELIEEMMLSRYHLISDDEKWSEDALSFLSCAVSGSLESLVNHRFLSLAVSPRRLIPRIRFAFEMSHGVYCGIDDEVLSDAQSHGCEYVSNTFIVD